MQIEDDEDGRFVPASVGYEVAARVCTNSVAPKGRVLSDKEQTEVGTLTPQIYL
jgi:hypothetical protein